MSSLQRGCRVCLDDCNSFQFVFSPSFQPACGRDFFFLSFLKIEGSHSSNYANCFLPLPGWWPKSLQWCRRPPCSDGSVAHHLFELLPVLSQDSLCRSLPAFPWAGHLLNPLPGSILLLLCFCISFRYLRPSYPCVLVSNPLPLPSSPSNTLGMRSLTLTSQLNSHHMITSAVLYSLLFPKENNGYHKHQINE